VDGGRVAGSSTSNLTITAVDAADSGNYWVVVSNAFGTATSIEAGIRITAPQKPRIWLIRMVRLFWWGSPSVYGQLPLAPRRCLSGGTALLER